MPRRTEKANRQKIPRSIRVKHLKLRKTIQRKE
jgi:hypothetical protein